ncbi:27961_t:CDS:1, partial [Racocetra persica]
NEENNGINNGEGSSNQILDDEIQFDNDPDNSDDKENEIDDFYEKESLEY